MLRLTTTPAFDRWMAATSDRAARVVIVARMTRLEAGDLGDAITVADNILEIPIDHGAGYRVYLAARPVAEGPGFLMLSGSDGISSHAADVARAQELAIRWKD